VCRLLVCVLHKQAVKQMLFTFWQVFRRSDRRLGMSKCVILVTPFIKPLHSRFMHLIGAAA